ncbi:MAG: hypothetical protein L0387_07730 [Acidobacteria bacterium]|nr:hypothetical protein [Acidobacteriota bacterium]
MNRWRIRTLLDRVVDERSLNLSDLRTLVHLHGLRPLDAGFLMKIGARYRSWSIPPSFPRYVRFFLQFCIDQLLDRDGIIYGSSPTIGDVQYRVLVSQYARAIGLTIRERRYHLQLEGLEGFCPLVPIELAEQDGVTSAYVCKVQAQFRRKLQLAVVGTELQFQQSRRAYVF